MEESAESEFSSSDSSENIQLRRSNRPKARVPAKYRSSNSEKEPNRKIIRKKVEQARPRVRGRRRGRGGRLTAVKRRGDSTKTIDESKKGK